MTKSKPTEKKNDEACQHKTFYWINKKNLNWRCTDTCGFQFFGKTVTAARKEARA